MPVSPQRQRIAGFAAIVEEERKYNAAQRTYSKGAAENAVPQRQRIAGNAAVVEKGQRHNAAQMACSKGAAKKDIPQRQRITGFAAVVEKERKDNAAQKACREGAQKRRCRNGRESQETLPLWKRDGGTMRHKWPVARVW